MSNRVAHFEIHADSLERAIAFYRNVFGWDFQPWPMPDGTTYWMILTAPKESAEVGINGGMILRPCPPTEGAASNAFVCTITVDSFDVIAEAILAHGGKVALPKMALAGMAWQGYFLDTEGNTFGIHQADPLAK